MVVRLPQDRNVKVSRRALFGFAGLAFFKIRIMEILAPLGHFRFVVSKEFDSIDAVAAFLNDRHCWENVRLLENVNTSFKDRGLLVNYRYIDEITKLKFEYIFLNKAAFHEWKQEIGRTGAIDHHAFQTKSGYRVLAKFV